MPSSRHNHRNPAACVCGEPGCPSFRRRQVSRRRKDVTAKNANTAPPGPCRRCKSTNATAWIAVDVNRYVSACVNCFDSAGHWAKLCPICGAMRVEHRGPQERCPVTAIVERALGATVIQEEPYRVLSIPKPKAITASEEPEIIEAEVVELPCTCSSPRYDGDDGYDRDCPQHGVNAVES